MRVLSLDLAGKSGWCDMEEYNGQIIIHQYGKFRTKGTNERERIADLNNKIEELFNSLGMMSYDSIIFEESVIGGKTSIKTSRATFGKRYLTISKLNKHLPQMTKIYSIKPNSWHINLPKEYRDSKIDFKVDGTPKKSKGKEKKELTLKWVNKELDLNLLWDEERINCDNDIADAIAMCYLFLTKLTMKELIG